MSSHNINFDYVNRYYRKDFLILKWIGVWVHDGTPKSTPYQIYFYFMNVLIFLFNVGQLTYALLNCDSLLSFASYAYAIPICIMANVKSFYIFRNRTQFYELYVAFSDDLFQPNTADQLVMVRNLLKFHSRVKIVLAVTCTTACFGSVTTPLFNAQNDQGLPFGMYCPFDISGNVIHTIVYLYQCVASFCLAYINIYTEILLAGFATFIALQCDLLCDNLKKIDTRDDVKSKKSLTRCMMYTTTGRL
nr:odorant receptor [Semanotus bifasciatus]